MNYFKFYVLLILINSINQKIKIILSWFQDASKYNSKMNGILIYSIIIFLEPINYNNNRMLLL